MCFFLAPHQLIHIRLGLTAGYGFAILLGVLRRGEWLTLLLLKTIGIIFMLVAHSDRENARAVDTAKELTSTFWRRPRWMLPISTLATSTFFGIIALHTVRRVGAASVLALEILIMRAIVAFVFNLSDSSLSMTFFSQIAILAPMFVLDFGFWSQNDKETPRTRNFAAIGALIVLTLISTPILQFVLDYFTLNIRLFTDIVTVGIPTALWFTWAGSLINTGMCNTPRLQKEEVEIIEAREAWISFIILFSCIFFVLFFIMTSTPSVERKKGAIMAEVQGIGGVFLYSNQAARLADWYTEILGIAFERHPDGTDRFFKVFLTRDPETSKTRENPVFAINQANDPIRSGGPTYMLNLRVDNLDEIIHDLQIKGVNVEPDVLVWERGKHAWIQDPDGNRIELYEEIFV